MFPAFHDLFSKNGGSLTISFSISILGYPGPVLDVASFN